MWFGTSGGVVFEGYFLPAAATATATIAPLAPHCTMYDIALLEQAECICLLSSTASLGKLKPVLWSNVSANVDVYALS